MAISKVILNGVTQMDVTTDTVDAQYMVSGKTATKADGTKTTGSLTSRSSSDLTASGATVTVPAGVYSSQASKAVASGSATTPATTVTANPSISVSSSGLITATASATKSVTPTVSAGYVSSGTAGTITVSGSNTSQLTTQAAKTVTPTTSSQTAVASGVYTTGAVTVAAMPSGTAGTPTATKGTVSNNSVSVTPSVTNTSGYITGSTKTGTAVTVTASELVSGTKSISQNGTGIDVTNYASVDVSVSAGSTHTATITQGVTSRTYISYNNVTYRATDATFEFLAGDTCSLVAYGEMAGGTIYEDGTQIGTSDRSSPYTYTLPDCDVEFELQTNGSGRIDITKVSSGGSTYSLTNIIPTQTIATTTSNLYGYVGLISSYTEYVQSGSWYLVTYDNVEYVVTGYYGANSEILVGDYQLITSNVEWLETPFMVEHNLTNDYFFLGSRVSGNHTLKVDKITFLDDGVTLINKTVTANGTYNASSDNADGFSSFTVNVAGGGGLEYEEGTYTPTSDISRPTISFSNTHSAIPSVVVMSDTSAASSITSDSNTSFAFYTPYELFGVGYPYSTTATRPSVAYYTYRTGSGSTGASTQITYPADNTGDTSTTYTRYWVTESGFKPYSNSSTRYWRSGRSYKWIAIWK